MEWGCLVPERDHAALAEALLMLAREPIRFAAMSAAAATRVSATFDLAKQAQALEGFYSEAIAHARMRVVSNSLPTNRDSVL